MDDVSFVPSPWLGHFQFARAHRASNTLILTWTLIQDELSLGVTIDLRQGKPSAYSLRLNDASMPEEYANVAHDRYREFPSDELVKRASNANPLEAVLWASALQDAVAQGVEDHVRRALLN